MGSSASPRCLARISPPADMCLRGSELITGVTRRRRWEQHILSTIVNRPEKKSDYVLLRSGQLVGTALIVLCKKEVAAEVRNVEAAIKKVRAYAACDVTSTSQASVRTDKVLYRPACEVLLEIVRSSAPQPPSSPLSTADRV